MSSTKVLRNQNSSNILCKLKRFGYDVRVMHDRCYYFTSKVRPVTREDARGPIHPAYIPENAVIANFGGYTQISVVSPSGNMFKGESECSIYDNFCKKTGRDIALSRVIKKIYQHSEQERNNLNQSTGL